MGLLINVFTNVSSNSGFGSSSTAEDVTSGISLSHITTIITEATSGIGAETTRVLAKRGACVVIPARNLKATQNLKSVILQETHDARVIILHMDLSSFVSIRSFAHEFLSLGLPLNILINNAGVFCKNFKQSEDGFEMSFATNHLGHFLLTNLLLERMVQSAHESGVQGRIVNVSSCVHTWVPHKGIDFHKLNDKNSYMETINYAQSKLANILHAKELARRLKEAKVYVTANSIHPGIVKTNIIRDRQCFVTDVILRITSIFMKTIPQGAATLCYVATHPNVKDMTGKYFVDCNEAKCSALANDEEDADQLWIFSEKLTNDRTSFSSQYQ